MNKNLLEYRYYSVATHSTVTVGTTSVECVAANQSRTYLFIQNDGSNDVYITLGTASVAGKGIRLGAGIAYEMQNGNLYDGAIYGISAAAGNNVMVTEGSGM
jgi:hypothetical protein